MDQKVQVAVDKANVKAGRQFHCEPLLDVLKVAALELFLLFINVIPFRFVGVYPI